MNWCEPVFGPLDYYIVTLGQQSSTSLMIIKVGLGQVRGESHPTEHHDLVGIELNVGPSLPVECS